MNIIDELERLGKEADQTYHPPNLYKCMFAEKAMQGFLLDNRNAIIKMLRAGERLKDVLVGIQKTGTKSCADAIESSLLNPEQHEAICFIHKALQEYKTVKESI